MLLSLLNIKNIKTDGENLQIENWIRNSGGSTGVAWGGWS